VARPADRRLTRRRLLLEGAAGLSTLALGLPRRAGARAADFDVCVIGSGFAGIPLALRCVQHGLRVAVVEAGSRFAPSFQYRNRGEVDYPVAAARLIALGGTSGHWGGVTTRLWPADFQLGSLYGDWVDWPIAYRDLDAYYCEAERFLGVVGSPPDPKAQPPQSCAYRPERGTHHPGFELAWEGRTLPFFRPPASRRRGQPLRLIDDEIPRFADSPGGTLLDGRRAVELVTLDGGAIDHLRTRDPAGGQATLRARVFVVAAGVVESPRLLLASRSQWFPGGLGNASGLVGRYFTYHPQFFTGSFQALGAREVPLRSNRTHGLDALLRGQHLNACNVQIVRPPPSPTQSFLLGMSLSPEVEPRPENRVALATDALDPIGQPLPELHFTHGERDRRSFARAQAIGDQLQRALGAAEPKPYRRRIHSHPAGTCRMASQPDAGVVDPDLRVFGLDNLYVSGASVFPCAGATNPTNTVVALALRLGDHLVARLAGRRPGDDLAG
jgi:choline dehydrogenase-like flavoprotein